jgi:hypothetical protein
VAVAAVAAVVVVVAEVVEKAVQGSVEADQVSCSLGLRPTPAEVRAGRRIGA